MTNGDTSRPETTSARNSQLGYFVRVSPFHAFNNTSPTRPFVLPVPAAPANGPESDSQRTRLCSTRGYTKYQTMSQPIPPPPPGGFYPVVISGYLDHQCTQFRLSASKLLLFVSVVLVLINALYGIPNYNDLVCQQLIYYDKKAISRYCFTV